jgi:hypothetical protein
MTATETLLLPTDNAASLILHGDLGTYHNHGASGDAAPEAAVPSPCAESECGTELPVQVQVRSGGGVDGGHSHSSRDASRVYHAPKEPSTCWEESAEDKAMTASGCGENVNRAGAGGQGGAFGCVGVGDEELQGGDAELPPGDTSSDTLGDEEEEEQEQEVAPEEQLLVDDKAPLEREPSIGMPIPRANSGTCITRTSTPNILPPTTDLSCMVREQRGGPNVPVPAAIVGSFCEKNNSMIDRRAWLEVEDPKHRYAKHLRMYHKEWDRKGQQMGSFWEWLEKGNVEVSRQHRAP